jgi:hypothetical protein
VDDTIEVVGGPLLDEESVRLAVRLVARPNLARFQPFRENRVSDSGRSPEVFRHGRMTTLDPPAAGGRRQVSAATPPTVAPPPRLEVRPEPRVTDETAGMKVVAPCWQPSGIVQHATTMAASPTGSGRVARDCGRSRV